VIETTLKGRTSRLPADEPSREFSQTQGAGGSFERQLRLMQTALQRHLERLSQKSDERSAHFQQSWQEINALLNDTPLHLAGHWAQYLRDAGERAVLSLDALRKRGDIFLEHEAAGAPPVLIYDHEVVVDGATLPRPCNYMLLAIAPPAGCKVHDWKRPYVIIDPRAGHGPGIGGFKSDSQVGVALRDGHPVYFVAFRPEPVPGQTLASITHAEAAFLREVIRRHPAAPKPIVVGNCQGGWATAILAATNPDLAGPIVLNGAPMSYWSGRLGQDPMRYGGGIFGGVVPAMLVSDLGGGVFDGAHLVSNFEGLNPARTWFRKYYDLFAHVDEGEERFLEFERWWGGIFLMNEGEIRWIVENLFVGNRLAMNEARLETGRPIDLKQIRAPIIVFASHGDNITPPQQALNWIVDTYANESEIEIRGQRILYMVHEEVGHLGIFVSSAVARREHSQVTSTVKTIEALAPGLYEMIIEDMVGDGHDKRFTVSFHKRRMADILAIGDGREEEDAFAAVARLSELLAESYDVSVRPLIKAVITTEIATGVRAAHPMRLQRTMFASPNPVMAGVAELAQHYPDDRSPAGEANPFLKLERLWADVVEANLETMTDLRAMFVEQLFLATYAGPWGQWFGQSHRHRRARKSPEELRALPEVIDATLSIEQGGLAEAVVRMLVLLANSRQNVRRDRLERSMEVLHERAPFCDMDRHVKSHLIHRQTLIAHFEPEAGLAALPALLATQALREQAIDMIDYVVGSHDDMEPATRELIGRMRVVLELAPARGARQAAE
jgi:pimeloyl-ACP methyl ester carboxylesterase